jgi:DNA polymerase-3 subunit delta'
VSTFNVEHQDGAARLIQRALFAERLPHAYIFCGPDGVGKETFGRALATTLLCSQPKRSKSADGEPRREACGRCEDCRLCGAGTHPDLHLIYRQLIKFHNDPVIRRRKGLELGVDVVRQFVINKVGVKPVRGRAKVFLIREADRITPQAQNALLKTLEEPPETTFLILLLSSLDRMLPTIRSRCHLTPFGTLPADFIAAKLVELEPDIPPERARLCARFSQGSLGLALQHAQDRLDEHNERLIEMLIDLPKHSVAQVVGQLDKEAKALSGKYAERDPEITDTEAQRRGLKALLALAATWYRDVLYAGAGAGPPSGGRTTSEPGTQPKSLVANVSHAERLVTAARATTPGRAVAAIGQLAEAESQLDANVNAKLCLDALVIRLGRLAGAA